LLFEPQIYFVSEFFLSSTPAGDQPEAMFGRPFLKWLAWWTARQRAQQCLPKSLLVYAVMNAPASSLAARPQRVGVVLDTNAVLDWLIFQNPSCTALGNAVKAGSVRLLTSPSLRGELSHVLARGVVNRWATDFTSLWATLDQHAVELADPPPGQGSLRLRCTDPDDQKFIDFAVAHQAQWLLTHDRAVLKLRKKALAFGLVIATPEEWSPIP
jgi:uncharacterized protein